jgi:hypothetical protein
MFCGETPCVCFGKKSAKGFPKPSTAPSASTAEPTPSQLSEPSTSDDWLTTSSKPKLEAPAARVETQEELIWKEAIRNLEPLLSGQEKLRYASILQPQQDAALYQKGVEVRASLATRWPQ